MSTGEDPAAWLRRVITASLEHHRQVAGSDDAGEKGARCEAELAILDEHKHMRQTFSGDAPFGCTICHVGANGEDYNGGWCRTVRLLASGYRHRNGYRDEWKP